MAIILAFMVEAIIGFLSLAIVNSIKNEEKP